MVIIRASNGCHRHGENIKVGKSPDQLNYQQHSNPDIPISLFLGTRICIQCPPLSSHPHLSKESGAKWCQRQFISSSATATEETQDNSATKKFRLDHHCHGRMALLGTSLTDQCQCEQELQFQILR